MSPFKLPLKYEKGPLQENGSYLYEMVHTSDDYLTLNLTSCDDCVQLAWKWGARQYASQWYTPLQIDNIYLEPGLEFADCRTPDVIQLARSLYKKRDDSQLLLLMTNFYNSSMRAAAQRAASHKRIT
jgi:hypothetical protein